MPIASHTDLASIVGQAIDKAIAQRLREHILKVIAPDIEAMLHEIMKDMEIQIRNYKEMHLDKSVLEILILDKREPKK